MSLRVAVSSADGKTVHQHFGQTTQFIVCEIDEDRIDVLERRANSPACGTSGAGDETGHDQDRMERTIALVADCRAVISAQIGAAAAKRLSEQGIQAFIIPDFVDSALARLVRSGALFEPVRPNKRWLLG